MNDPVRVMTAAHKYPESPRDKAIKSGNLPDLITTTMLSPNLPDTGNQTFNITVLPPSLIFYDDLRVLTEDELGLQVLAQIETLTDLAPSVAALLSYYPRESQEHRNMHYFREQVKIRFGQYRVGWFDLPPDDAVKEFSEYITFGETALVEESPPRRASPAAVAASKMATRMFTAGGAGTSVTAVLAHSDTSFFIVIMGSGVTLLMSTAGAGLILATHWLGKKLEV